MKINKLCELLTIAYPIIQAPMAGGATTPELVAAVSNHNGLGTLGAGYMSPKEIRKAIKEIRSLTNKPFAVNLFIPDRYQATAEQMEIACQDINACCKELSINIRPIPTPYAPFFEEQIEVLLEEQIPVFSYVFGSLSTELINAFKRNKSIVIGTATTLAEAKVLEQDGIDALVVQGSEAGGHRGSFLTKAEHGLIPVFSLLKQCVHEIKIPVIAAGGIMTGSHIRAALNEGASGVQLGTAFLTCYESGIPAVYKDRLLSQKTDNTVLTRAFSGKMARGLRNKFTECMDSKKQNILDYPIQNALTSFMRLKAKEQNNAEFLSMWAGQSAHLCRNLSADALMDALLSESGLSIYIQ